jgi:hypothetical protein
MAEKERVDNSQFYKHTDSPLRDKIFNAIVKRYEKNGHVWEKSDDVVWGGTIYVVASYFGYTALGGLLWWLLNATVKYQGADHAVLLMLILIFLQLLRVNTIMRKVDRDMKGDV